MLTKIRSGKAIAALLSCAMLMSLAGCSSDKKTGSDYKLPEGASSEYEVYVKAVDHANGDSDAVDDVFDPILTLVFYTKGEDPDENYTLGLDINESCNLISRMADKISDMGLGYDYDNDDIDFDTLIEELPEDRQAMAREDLDEFEDFVEMIAYGIVFRDEEIDDGFVGFDLSFETIDEEDYASEKMDDDWLSDDFLKYFGNARMVDLGSEKQGNSVISVECYIMEIDGAYYLLSFTTTVGATGG